MAAGTLITAEQFLDLPDRYDSSGNLIQEELLGGEIREVSSASRAHDKVKNHIGFLLRLFLHQHPELPYVSYIEIGLRLRDDYIVRADVCLVDRSKDETAVERVFSGAPALAIEVISPSDQYGYVNEKTQVYLQAGSTVVWLVNPFYRAIDEITVRGTRRFQEFIEIPELLPAFRLSIAEIFAGI